MNKWRDLSIAKKLYFVVGIMAILITGELLTLRFAMKTLSAVRGFVGGEGTWSKAQKNAAFSLQRYGVTHKEEDYQEFLNFFAVSEGDHQARVELLRSQPDLKLAREGFLAGKIHPDDVNGLIELLRRFYWISYLDRAIGEWSKADSLLADFKIAGESYHQLVKEGRQNSTEAGLVLSNIHRLNEELTVAESNFSNALGEGSRWLEHMIISLLFSAVLMVEAIGLTLTFRTSRNISKGLNDLNDAARKIGDGDFSQRLSIHSKEEIGMLTQSVNRMGELLQKTYSGLEGRVAARTAELTQMAAENAKLYEEAKAAVQVREEFLSIASHELKTPLAAQYLQLQILLRLVKKHPNSSEFLRMDSLVESAVASAQRLSKLIEELII